MRGDIRSGVIVTRISPKKMTCTCSFRKYGSRNAVLCPHTVYLLYLAAKEGNDVTKYEEVLRKAILARAKKLGHT